MRTAAVFFLYSLLGGAFLLGQPQSSRSGAERLLEVDDLSQEEAALFLDRFRSLRLSSDYIFDFELKYLPARSRSQTFKGKMFGTWENGFPRQRIDFSLPNGAEPVDRPGGLLFSAGQQAGFYQAGFSSSSWESLEGPAAYRPFIGSVPITPFELQMPFVFWDEWQLHGRQRILGRPAYTFDMIAPADVRTGLPELDRVRLSLDADFSALLRADMLDAEGKVLKSIRVLSFKKVGDDWVPKAIDYVSPGVRDKARFRVRSAALGIHIDRSVFDENEQRDEVELSTVSFNRL